MSEKLVMTETRVEAPKSPERKALPTAEQAEPLRRGEADPTKALHEARKSIAETAQADTQTNPLEQLRAAETAAQPATPGLVSRSLRQITLRRELKTIRRQLPWPQRSLSYLVHQPVIRQVSETAGKTISRPSGLLGGGLVAFAGSSLYLYLAKHLGWHYNYFAFILLFGGGFLLGLLLELAVFVATRKRLED